MANELNPLSNLTNEDYDTLLEAMDAWKGRGGVNAIMNSLVDSIVSDRDDPAAKQRFMEKQSKLAKERKEQEAIDEITVVMLKAKLIYQRRQLGLKQLAEQIRPMSEHFAEYESASVASLLTPHE